MSLRSAVALVVLSIVRPLCNRAASSARGWSSTDRDIAVVRTAAACLTTGALVLSTAEMSWTAVLAFVLLAFGAPFAVVGKSLLTVLGPGEMAGTLLSSVNTAASRGAVISGPIVAVSFQHGLRRGGSWVGTSEADGGHLAGHSKQAGVSEKRGHRYGRGPGLCLLHRGSGWHRG